MSRAPRIPQTCAEISRVLGSALMRTPLSLSPRIAVIAAEIDAITHAPCGNEEKGYALLAVLGTIHLALVEIEPSLAKPSRTEETEHAQPN